MTFGEILSKAAVNTCLGMGTVFLMLVFISCVIFLFKFIPGEAAPGAEPQEAEEDSELIPAIIAAVLAASEREREPEVDTYSYVVKSIKRR